MVKKLLLCDALRNQQYIICDVVGDNRIKLLELGFIKNTKITYIGSGFFKYPKRFKIRNYILSLSEDICNYIYVSDPKQL